MWLLLCYNCTACAQPVIKFRRGAYSATVASAVHAASPFAHLGCNQQVYGMPGGIKLDYPICLCTCVSVCCDAIAGKCRPSCPLAKSSLQAMRATAATPQQQEAPPSAAARPHRPLRSSRHHRSLAATPSLTSSGALGACLEGAS